MIIRTEDLRRDYLVGTRLRRRRVTAVADVTLTVEPGEAATLMWSERDAHLLAEA